MKNKYWYGLLQDGILVHIVDWDEPDVNDEVFDYIAGDIGLIEGREYKVVPLHITLASSHVTGRVFCSGSVMDHKVDGKRYSFVEGCRYTVVSIDTTYATLINKFDTMSVLDIDEFNTKFRQLNLKEITPFPWSTEND